MFRNIADIKCANRVYGRYFFEPDTMRFFGSRVLDEVYGGRYYVTSEKPPYGPRAYTVRRAGSEGEITTIGKVCQYATAAQAKGAARIAAAAEAAHAPSERKDDA